MTIREFLEFIDGDKSIRIYDGENKILQIDICYIGNIKDEILDRKIKKAGIHIMNNYVINITFEQEKGENCGK